MPRPVLHTRKQLQEEPAKGILGNVSHPHQERIPLVASRYYHERDDRFRELDALREQNAKEIIPKPPSPESEALFTARHALRDYVVGPDETPGRDEEARENALKHLEDLNDAHSLLAFASSPHHMVRTKAEGHFMNVVSTYLKGDHQASTHSEKAHISAAIQNALLFGSSAIAGSYANPGLQTRVIDSIVHEASVPRTGQDEKRNAVHSLIYLGYSRLNPSDPAAVAIRERLKAAMHNAEFAKHAFKVVAKMRDENNLDLELELGRTDAGHAKRLASVHEEQARVGQILSEVIGPVFHSYPDLHAEWKKTRYEK